MFSHFWFRIVSIATAVLPVCLSQIINSLCHLPIGTILSIALIPVCSGSSTDFLVTTLGAIISTGYVALTLISFHQSIGAPIPLTTLPKKSSHTQTENTFPLVLTICHGVSPC